MILPDSPWNSKIFYEKFSFKHLQWVFSSLVIFNDIFLYNAMKPETLFCLWMGPKYLLWPCFGSLPNFIDHLTINDFFCQHFFRLFESFLCPNGILMDGLDITREKVIATFQPIIAWYILCKFWISYPYLTTHGTLFISFLSYYCNL